MSCKRIMRPKQVAIQLGISRATLYRREADGLLPRRVTNSGCSGWFESDIDAFIEQLPRGGDARRVPRREHAQ